MMCIHIDKEFKMTDIEKVKIEILRDALKDAIDTVRALDRKIIFLVSYNAIFFGLISSFFLKHNYVSEHIVYIKLFYSILGIIILLWLFNFIKIMTGIAPKSNPIDVFKKEEDKNFSNNIFFIFTGGKENSLILDNMLIAYNKIDSYDEIQKLLYKEIGKVSYIRDIKLKEINESVIISGIVTVCFIILVSIFLLLPLKS
jgi:hypothetical protein